MAEKKVLFASARAKEWDYKQCFVAKLEEALKQIDLSNHISKGDYVAIKAHLGSLGSHRIVRPFFLRRIVDAVRAAGGNPFVTDSCRIPGLEYFEIANTEGLTQLSCGAPLILADGIKGTHGKSVECGPILGKVAVSGNIADADVMVVVTHVTGHPGSGFGGSIKNVGMGCIALMERGRVHSSEEVQLEVDWEKCVACGMCVDNCEHDALHIVDGKLTVEYEKCMKCARCTNICPNDALNIPGSEERFQGAIAEATKAVLSTFKEGKVIYINFLTEIQPGCDCVDFADTPVVQDQGVLLSDDIVAIDKASLDMVERATPLPQSLASDKGLSGGDNLFKKLTGRDPYQHVYACSDLDLGSLDYEIVEIKRKQDSSRSQ